MISICWASLGDPKTLINIGMEAVAMRMGNTLSFYNLTTNTKSFFQADTNASGGGMSLIAGHNRFPLFAYAEAVLRPSIHILKYPDFTTYGVYPANNNLSYTDMRFSEFDHLVALTGFPDYVLRVWNIRTGVLLVETTTNIKCGLYCLNCSANGIPVILQFSQTTKEISIWEMALTEDVYFLHEIARIPLGKGYNESYEFCTCFTDDGTLYVVNDYGTLSSVEITEFYLRTQWIKTGSKKPRAHYLYYHKQGMIIANQDVAYFLRKKTLSWNLEWKLVLSNSKIKKFLSNFNNETYAVDEVGNVFQIVLEKESTSLQQLTTSNCKVQEYATIKGIKEESVLLLDSDGGLRLVDVMRCNMYSKLQIDLGCALAAHNLMPFASVGTDNGKIYFISYEKPRAPFIISTISIALAKIRAIRLLDFSGFVRDEQNGFHIIQADFKRHEFSTKASIESDNVHVVNFFMIDENSFLIFISREVRSTILCASEVWIFQWMRETQKVKRIEFHLPNKYRSFSLPQISNKESIEFLAVRCNSNSYDIFYINNFKELVLSRTIVTHHFGNLTGISGTRHMITWSVDSNVIQFRSHKKGNKPYMISRFLQFFYFPRVMKSVEDCYNAKYLLVLKDIGILRCFKLPPLSDQAKENSCIPCTTTCAWEPHIVRIQNVQRSTKHFVLFVPTEADLQARTRVENAVKALSSVVTELINYDISVTQKESGSFSKFCLNNVWLQMLTEQTRLLLKIERKALLLAIADQERIRDWLRTLITSTISLISTKIRAIFSNACFENFAIRKQKTGVRQKYIDYFLFYDMDPIEEEYGTHREEEEKEAVSVEKEQLKRYVKVPNMYDHVFDPMFQVQNKDEVTSNQMMNAIVKSKKILTDSLKQEFNKKFIEVHKMKQELMDSIVSTNGTLTRIFDNMNCMLGLLKMDTFTPDKLSVPIWMIDEVLERIMTVDDSEVKAINRRKQKKIVTAHKSGRMLLWDLEFWVRALQIMMDGVLEKLWEEEIKKEIPPPEFLSKKQDHEYTLEDQKQLREYEEKLKLLAEDRRKYLRILNENERQTQALKKNLIMKVNEKCTEMAILKLKYDFAVKQEQMRVLNMKLFHFKRMQWRRHITELREDVEKLSDFIEKYTKLVNYWENSVNDVKNKMEAVTIRDKTLDRQLKANYLNTIPPNFTSEISKLYKRRPKITQKSFGSSLVCLEIAARILNKPNRLEFPLPTECNEYFTALKALDDPQNLPNMEPKHWDAFTKLRRQKIENELKVKAIGYQLIDFQNALNSFVKSCANLKVYRTDALNRMEVTAAEYFETLHNQRLQVTLTMGQVEVVVGGNLSSLNLSILMNIKDIEDVNNMIKTAGAKKLKAMQRVAVFRRQVIFKEWEHKVTRANIDYLNYMLSIIENCKVTQEFLSVLRNWETIKKNKHASRSVGILERAIEEKLSAFRKNLDRILQKIDIVRAKIEDVKRNNQNINKAIDEVKVDVTLANVKRDFLGEDRRKRELQERMAKVKKYSHLIEEVRRDYAHMLELNTILELQRLRTYPTLAPAPPACPEFECYQTH